MRKRLPLTDNEFEQLAKNTPQYMT